jgi:hypothetical protein
MSTPGEGRGGRGEGNMSGGRQGKVNVRSDKEIKCCSKLRCNKIKVQQGKGATS